MQAAKFYEGLADTQGDVHLHQRHYAYKTEAGWVAGCDFSVMFTLDRSAREIWPHFKDFNLWQNAYGYYYSGVVGDLYSEADLKLGEKLFQIGIGSKEAFHPYAYQVLRVIPEHLIVVHQPIPQGGANGGISPGTHVFMLNEHQGRTIVTVVMEHARRTKDETEEEALAYWREMAPEVQRMWRDVFIPNLKKLVYEGQ